MVLLVLQIHASEAILQVFAECAEFAVVAVRGVEAKISSVVVGAMDALVAPFIFEAVRQVAAIFVTVGFNAKETILQGEGIVAAVAVLAFGEVVADTVLAAELMYAEVRRSLAQFLQLFLHGLALVVALEIQGSEALRIFLLRVLLIEDAILLLIEADASEAVAASEAVLAELAVAAVRAVLAVIGHVAVRAVDALGAPFAPNAEGEAAAACALARVACVVDVFRVKDAEAVVAILRSHCFRVVTVFGPILDEVVAGFCQKKPLKFLEEIHIISVRECV